MNSLSGPSTNPSDCTTLDNWAFENFTLVYEPFSNVLRLKFYI